jgi:hypothetical protein
MFYLATPLKNPSPPLTSPPPRLNQTSPYIIIRKEKKINENIYSIKDKIQP